MRAAWAQERRRQIRRGLDRAQALAGHGIAAVTQLLLVLQLAHIGQVLGAAPDDARLSQIEPGGDLGQEACLLPRRFHHLDLDLGDRDLEDHSREATAAADVHESRRAAEAHPLGAEDARQEQSLAREALDVREGVLARHQVDLLVRLHQVPEIAAQQRLDVGRPL